MALPEPAPGLVISYAYPWRDEHRAGAEEGRKDRPSAIVLTSADRDGDKIVLVVPITHSKPAADQHAVELPGGQATPRSRRRAVMGHHQRT